MLVLYPRMAENTKCLLHIGIDLLKDKREICEGEKTTTTRLTAKTGNEDDLWFLMTGTVHCGLMRQPDQRATSTLAHMKYGGRISRRLSQEPDGVVIHDVRSQAKTRTQTHSVLTAHHKPLSYCC